MRYICTLLLLFCLALPSLAQPKPKGAKLEFGEVPLGTERRVAIILANQNYTDDRLDLAKAYNDAADMKQTLELLGFEVIALEKDLNRLQLDRLLNGLQAKLRGYNVAFFYYSGHGSEYEGKNYLLPTDMPTLEFRSDIATYGISLDRVYSALISGGIKTSFVVVDACRSLPMGRSAGLPTGMVLPANNPTGTFTMFATRSGNLAQENTRGRNGYFTQELRKNLIQPNWAISKIFYETRKGVKAATNNQQDPSSSNELDDDFVFVETKRETEAMRQIAEGKQAYVAEDYAKAYRLLFVNADQLDAEGQKDLGVMYYHGWGGLSINKVEALKWYQKAAAGGNATAHCNIGYMYDFGEGGLSVDKVEALKWYRKAADLGSALAQNNIGYMYDHGEGGLSVDKVEALKWYRKAAEQGDALAQGSLGVMYYRGEGGLSVDKVEALKWYRKSAKQENAVSQFNIGYMYYHGEGGLSVDKAEALNWYRKSAEQGDEDAQHNLGYMYENGEGVIKDLNKAIQYYQLAARQGNVKSQTALKRLGKTW